MVPLISSLILLATLLIQTPANPTADKGVISGRLLAVDGTPAIAVRVMAMAVVEPALAERSGNAIAIVSLTETDSAGRYRLENIPSGKYYVTAGLTDLPTYFPGAVAAAAATVISVAPGSITTGIDFAMQRGTGVKVTGQLAVLPTLKPSTPARATLMGPPMLPIETSINDDGTFVFPMVRPGTYTLRTINGLFAPTAIVVSDRDLNVVVGGDEKGVRVIGKAVVSSDAGAPVATQQMNLNASGQSFSTLVNADGSFEFLRVPPGVYMVRSLPSMGLSTNATVVVADKDITNLEVSVPFIALVSGGITVENGAAPQFWGIEARSFNGTTPTGLSVTTVGSSGPFTLRLSEGSHQISIRNLPSGYVIKSISSGDLDLMNSSLDVRPGKPIAEIRIVVGKTPVESITGVRVSGKVSGLTNSIFTTARVTLLSRDLASPAIETTVNADGTFEFIGVPTGRYNAKLTGIPPSMVSPLSLQIFVEEPVSGLQFTVSP